ncbi:MAG TPA: ribosome biogenesis GTPase Der [Polyangiaceae bacterium LLY-WYZ-14_1]|nr:ribosome biogenesis GTPase Der [Polyangiaceae bacterium LLY-WYZ-14_1]
MRGRRSPREDERVPVGALVSRPLVAIVGRPNVGKSTLFNRLVGRRLAIVEDVAGVTRDRQYADATALGREYVLVDTGGFDPESDDPMTTSIAAQVRLAVEECDLVICVLDAAAELTPQDQEAVRLLRESERPTLFVTNKADSPKKAAQGFTYYELGVDRLLPVSALHGHGIGDLEEALAEALDEVLDARLSEPGVGGADGGDGEPEDLDPDIPRIAVVGKPNAGKSSLVNRLLGAPRQIVDDRPGTTTDSIDTLVHVDGEPLRLIDTAGIRRKRSVVRGVEALSVLQAIRAMERSDVVVLMVDAELGVVEQDAKIAGLAEDRGRALVVALNKADRLDGEGKREAKARAREVLAFAPWAPVLLVSARSGRGVGKLVAAARRAVAEHRKRIPTAEVNRFFDEVLEHHPPPTMRKKPVRLYYVTQAQVRPPTFVVVVNEPNLVHFSYQRYVVNQIRDRFGFEGTPVRVRYRARRRRE